MASVAHLDKGQSARRRALRTQKRVLLAMSWYEHRVHAGIAKYAIEHNWHLCPEVTKEKVIPWGWEGDGILAWLGAGDDLVEFVVQARKPTVDFSFRRPELPFPHVLADEADAARLVADHYLARGFTHFMFYSGRVHWTFERLGNAFKRCIEEAGYPCSWICWERAPDFRRDREEWGRKRAWLARELKRTPKPLALYAANDEHADEVVQTCESAGIVVPDEISVIAIDNSLPFVDDMPIPISSVDLNYEERGYRGAALLDELMRGQPAPKEPIYIPLTGLIARKSSDFVAVPHTGVARGLRFMLKHFHEPITVEDMARAAGLSKRGFHTAFLQHVRRSPGHELHHLRIEHAKKLLTKTNVKVHSIVEQCGFRSNHGFWYAFTAATGQSPRQYREARK